MRVSGFEVTSCKTYDEASQVAREARYDLVLIDVESERDVKEADELCSVLKSIDPDQKIAFACNWRVAILNHCPDEIVRSEFDPLAFITGVQEAVRT